MFTESAEGVRQQCVPWGDCVAYVRQPDRRLIYGRDGYMLGIDTGEWEEGAAALATLDQFAPAAVTVG